MHDDRSSLLPPSPADLPLLFEASRLLGRYESITESIEPLLSLLEERAGFGCARAALGRGIESPLPFDPRAGLRILSSALAGRARVPAELSFGEGSLGRAIAGAAPVIDGDEVALPILIGGIGVGAISFRPKPAARERTLVLGKAVAALVAEAVALRRKLAKAAEASQDELPAREIPAASSGLPGGIVGSSTAIRELFALIERVAKTETTVLITGESGAGKELVARALHDSSPRSRKPFVAVSCAALPESLIESELFGHERGAFTGAQVQRRGRFELADGGSLFLDEIGELSSNVQAKLLRVLQEGEFQRVGASATLHADVRVIAATNRDLERDTEDGRFRRDLFWRLNVFPIRVPPLRERRPDIILLADHFAEKYGSRSGKKILRISSPAIDLLMSYHWPGNVRELENCIERAVVLSADSVIHAYHLPPSLQSAESTGTGPGSTLDAALARLERELLIEALKICKGNAAAAARKLGLSERRMGLAMRRFGVDWRRFRTQT